MPHNNSLNIAIPEGKMGQIAKYWLLLAIASLSVAGLFSLPPVIFRGPFFADKLPVDLIFATSLVIHVDLSVVVWFLSIGGFFWSLIGKSENLYFYKASFFVAALGMIAIAVSPFIGASNPLKNNYIPMLQNFTFVLGLSLFACGILFQALLTLPNYKKALQTPLGFGIYISALIALIAAACFAVSYNFTPLPTDGDFLPYYESLFWGGGHVLQFVFTTLMLLAWLWLSNICSLKSPLPAKIIYALFSLNLLIILPSPLFYLTDNVVFVFAQQMKYFAGLAALIIGVAIILSLFKPRNIDAKDISHNIKAALILSILLFGYGGVLGHMISGVNVTIPAHYHGSIVAVTLSFMGLSYYLLPQFGFAEIKGKIATSQPYIYGIGQVMHITGLAWMGGYGALRKSAASSQTVDTVAGKALFFSGGALAITGGLLFVIVALRSIFGKK
jgi:cytochrome c oxidase subunit 1